MAKINATTMIYQQAWVKAYQTGEIELTFRDAAEAARARFSLYNAVKESRTDLPADVREAYLNVSLQVGPDGRGNVIRLRRADRDPMAAAISAQLGLSLDPALVRSGLVPAVRAALLPEDIQASGDRLLKLLEEEPEAKVSNEAEGLAGEQPGVIPNANPFYRR